jgi:pimeloyl-ACP methyl ester carboxylesterase
VGSFSQVKRRPPVNPQTRYAHSDGLDIAYQVVGDGPRDVLFVPGFVSHLDLQWADPAMAVFLGKLAAFSRLIIFDKRGTGLSDPCFEVPTMEQRMDDMLAVMDAAGSSRATILGFSEGGQTSICFTATHPDCAERLVLYGTYARGGGGVVQADRYSRSRWS